MVFSQVLQSYRKEGRSKALFIIRYEGHVDLVTAHKPHFEIVETRATAAAVPAFNLVEGTSNTYVVHELTSMFSILKSSVHKTEISLIGFALNNYNNKTKAYLQWSHLCHLV